MDYRRYAWFTIVGAAGWVVSMTVLGFFIGKSPLGKHIEIVIVAVVLLSITPGLIAWLRARKQGAAG